jgi:hypothetical protein
VLIVFEYCWTRHGSGCPNIVSVSVLQVFVLALIYTFRFSTIFSSITYAHHIDFFGNNKFDRPENYGLARESINNFHHTTTELGAS